MSKAYNIIEASNITNTEFKVVYKSGEDRVRNVYVDAHGTILNMVNEDEMPIVKGYGDLINAKFYKIQQQVDFVEAIKASSEGKVIHVDVGERRYTYYPVDNKFVELTSTETKGGISTCEILEGKWYIEAD